MACVRASIAVAAVTLGGRPRTNIGSRKAIIGAALGDPIVNLNLAAASVMTTKGVTSAAVPTVVGSANNGSGEFGNFSHPS